MLFMEPSPEDLPAPDDDDDQNQYARYLALLAYIDRSGSDTAGAQQLGAHDLTKLIIKVTSGDTFHFLRRVKVPTIHPSKKAYFRALTEAWYM